MSNIFRVKKRNQNISFFSDDDLISNFVKNSFPSWEKETFDIFDKYLDPNKQFLDIGGWIGTTCIYASRLSSEVVCIEADNVALDMLNKNIKLNECENIKVVPNAIFNEKTNILFGPSTNNINHSRLNDSGCHIKFESNKSEDYLIQTVTLDDVITNYKLNNLSLIKVDIEGGEEYILNDLYHFCSKNKVPLFLSFHYCWWIDKNLSRFNFLNSDTIIQIQKDPLCSILFSFTT
jgi:FkbM family methyltransferase